MKPTHRCPKLTESPIAGLAIPHHPDIYRQLCAELGLDPRGELLQPGGPDEGSTPSDGLGQRASP